ncbi:hypothetical protein M9H77_17332 [Catharanthus roseus]|uniref:Uncharacterized protein n=1 Tax=Catharanthus roseus TaxID=4058 RepID=A0ACC0B4B1_CATRO|nr:hypothetical protein M9H77_17332 [Catharanthus roseus]
MEEGYEAPSYINPHSVLHPPPLMAERTMADYARPSISGMQYRIGRPRVEVNNFEIKLNVIRMLQNNVKFDGLPEEHPNAYISNFLEMVGSPFAQAGKLPPIFGNMLTSALE